jgi:hypothetical protein
LKQNSEKPVIQKTNNYYSSIGILLMILGIVLYITLAFNLKISVTFIFIGFVITLMASEKNTYTIVNDMQLILIIILLTLIALIVTLNENIDIFIILIIISVIALREFLDKLLSPQLRKRMNILFYILIIVFVIIVAQRIINISTMYPS